MNNENEDGSVSVSNNNSSSQIPHPIVLRPLSQIEGAGVVYNAMIANMMKFSALSVMAFVTRSHVLYAEAAHSAGDTVNQIVSLLSLRYATRSPDWTHPYGYGSRRWVVAFTNGVVLFGMSYIYVCVCVCMQCMYGCMCGVRVSVEMYVICKKKKNNDFFLFF